MNIYVGNLSYKATEDALRQAFAAYGQVCSVAIIKDAETGQSRGFAFVEMPNAAEGQAQTHNNLLGHRRGYIRLYSIICKNHPVK